MLIICQQTDISLLNLITVHKIVLQSWYKFLNGNIPRAPENTEKLLLRANAKGKPEYVTQAIDGVTYTVVKVADKFYVPDRTQTV